MRIIVEKIEKDERKVGLRGILFGRQDSNRWVESREKRVLGSEEIGGGGEQGMGVVKLVVYDSQLYKFKCM